MAGLTAQSPSGGVQIVHAIRGRVRIRAVSNGFQPALATAAQELRQLQGIKEVSINQQTASLVVTFDESRLSLPALLEALRRQGVAVAGDGISPETELWNPVSAALTAAPLDSVIPLMVGVLVTQRLGIVGLPAIPVYLIAAGTTRQVIDQGQVSRLSYAELLQPPDIGSEKAPAMGAQLYRLAHAVPGRVRFQIPRLAWDAAYARRARDLIEAAEGVTEVRVSFAAASLAVTYRSGAVSDAEMRSRLAQLIERAAQVPAPSPPAPPDPSASAATSRRKPLPPAAGAPPEALARALGNGRNPPPPAPEAAPFGPNASASALGNGRKPLPPPEPAPPVPSSQQATERSRWLKSLAAETPAAPVPQKNSMWGQYKPPALSVFLAFMANLY